MTTIRPLPSVVTPLDGESLNGLVARLAAANHVPINRITGGAGGFVMRPNTNTVRSIARVSGLPPDTIRSLGMCEPIFGHFESMGFNDGRKLWCTTCSDDRRDWYRPLAFACTRCRRLLTDGTSPALKLSADTIAVQTSLTLWARHRSDRAVNDTLLAFTNTLSRARHLTSTAFPRVATDSAQLIDHAKLSALRPHDPLPVHPPTTALGAVTWWRRATREHMRSSTTTTRAVRDAWDDIDALRSHHHAGKKIGAVQPVLGAVLVHFLTAAAIADNTEVNTRDLPPLPKDNLTTYELAALAAVAAQEALE